MRNRNEASKLELLTLCERLQLDEVILQVEGLNELINILAIAIVKVYVT